VAQAIVIRAGVKVQPGAAVTTQGEADDPSLGKVTAVTAADLALTRSLLAQSIGLTTGYTLLYQGNSSTGPNPGTTVSGVFNGNLAAVSGASRNPARPATPFPSTAPKFVGPHRPIVPAALSLFRARVIGGVVFGQRADAIASRVGRGVSIRADVGQPIRIGSIARMGNNVTIHAPQGGTLSIGSNLSAGERAAILGGPAATIGDNVTIGAGAVISGSTVGSGAVVGDNAVLINTTILPGEVVPPGTVRVG
jgi:carbonic anhydrase/acetyltransferase-like protein (isoleucine patch superfamily)